MNAVAEVNDEENVDVEIEATEEEQEEAKLANPNVDDQLKKASSSDDVTPDDSTPEDRAENFSEDKEEYSKKVEKRIKKLTYQMHEEERQKQAALDYAEQVKQENEQLKARQVNQGAAFLTEQQNRLKSEIERAKDLYKEAHRSNDGELLAEATQNLTNFSTQLANVEAHLNRTKQQMNKPQAALTQQQPYKPAAQQQPQPRQQQPQNAPDPKAEAWAEKNEWFGEDEVMTNAALTIHRSLVQEEGYLAEGESYYEELDQRMRKNFPHKFKVAAPRSNGGGAVTPVGNTRNTVRNGKKTVTLTPSQISVARKLGVPLEEYAKYV